MMESAPEISPCIHNGQSCRSSAAGRSSFASIPTVRNAIHNERTAFDVLG